MSTLSVLPKPIFHINHQHRHDTLSTTEEKKLHDLNIFYDCGKDHHNRIIIAVAACHLPDPKLISHDSILTYFVSKLEELKQDFVIVFFSSPTKYKPSFLWCIRSFKILNEFFQKNLKELYIIHMPHYFQQLVVMANKIITSEHTKNMHYLSTLDELDQMIHLEHLRIPHQVIEHELILPHSLFSYHHHYYHGDHQHAHHAHHRHHHHTHHHHHYVKHKEEHEPTGHFVFGRTLNDLAKLENKHGDDDEGYFIPNIVIRLLDHIILNDGLLMEGIFRKSPLQTDLSEARDVLDKDPNSELEIYDMHTIAALVKMFFSGLPYPLLESEFVTHLKLDRDDQSLKTIKMQLIEHYKDRPKHFYLLKYLIDFLAKVSDHVEQNKMTIHNLAIVFAPSLVRSTMPLNDILTNPADASVYLQQTKHHMAVIELLIEQRDLVF